MRYLVVRPSRRVGVAPNASPGSGSDTDEEAESKGEILGFLSFMLTVEDDYPVIYCYEIHLSPSTRGCGLGKHLMGLIEEIGGKVGVEKAMLTVFLRNNVGMKFYERIG